MDENRMKLPLFDDYWIDFSFNTTRRWFAPELYSICPAGPYSSMFYDPIRNRYRVYFEEVIRWGDDGPRQLKLL